MITTTAHANLNGGPRAIARKTRVGKADGPASTLTLHHEDGFFYLTFCVSVFDELMMRHVDARAIRVQVEEMAADDVIGPDAFVVLVTNAAAAAIDRR